MSTSIWCTSNKNLKNWSREVATMCKQTSLSYYCNEYMKINLDVKVCCVNHMLDLVLCFHFQLAVRPYSTCQDISSLHHFLDIILITCSARGTSPSHLATLFTWNSKNSDLRIILRARTVFFRFSMDTIRQRQREEDSVAICIHLS